MKTLRAELVLEAKADLGEGPVWHDGEQRLYWVDITRGQLCSLDPASGQTATHTIGQEVGCAVPRAAGGWLLGLRRGLATYESGTGTLEMIADPEFSTTGNRFNDGKCDPAGRLWAGTIGKPGSATLWRLDRDRRVTGMLRGITCSNGLAWSPDGRTFYYIDTPTRQIVAYDYERETGDIANPRVAVDVPADLGAPDGMAIDVEGMLWVGLWDGRQVIRWDPRTGEALAQIPVPASRATSCAFGGTHLDILYITSARTGLSPEQLACEPLAGGVFAAMPGVSGAPVPAFAG
ncbi:MAG: SMP-30/gluconolactonase/LRE family protein [Lentisphaerae bacterium]|nr:SMP-30/gluconolactonase/LRE family protein [Lentisphaerota bacterium]